MAQKIIFTVTNDLTYDQRMQRICKTLATAGGHEVLLIGRNLKTSKLLDNQAFAQKRLPCFFTEGFLFYAEFNTRLFFFLLFSKFDIVGTVDLDTMPAGCLAGILRGKKRVFDAHEFYTETPEVCDRPFVKGFWELVGQVFVRFYHRAFTVGPGLAEIFSRKYGKPFGVVRNVPFLSSPQFPENQQVAKIILYQGALNEGRGIAETIKAMELLTDLKLELWLAGEGDLSENLRRQAKASPAKASIKFLGFVKPNDLKKLTAQCWVGLNLLENKGLSYYHSLANKFFDYVQAEKPGISMAFPEYVSLCREFEVALLLDELSPEKIAFAVRKLAEDEGLFFQLKKNCSAARLVWNWESEKMALLKIFTSLDIEPKK